MEERRVRIDRVEALRRLADAPGAARAAREVELRLPGLPEPEAERFRGELRRYADACGCDSGARGVLLGLLAFALAWGAGGFPGGVPAGVAGGALALFGAGALGKAWGLLAARRRFRRAARELLARLEAGAAATGYPSPSPTCSTPGAGRGAPRSAATATQSLSVRRSAWIGPERSEL